MKFIIHSSECFDKWLDDLKDRQARIAILKRIERAAKGNLGDCKPIKGDNGKGLYEMRIDFGPGYRIYYGKMASAIYLLISGGIKKHQDRNIATAKSLWAELRYDEFQD